MGGGMFQNEQICKENVKNAAKCTVNFPHQFTVNGTAMTIATNFPSHCVYDFVNSLDIVRYFVLIVAFTEASKRNRGYLFAAILTLN